MSGVAANPQTQVNQVLSVVCYNNHKRDQAKVTSLMLPSEFTSTSTMQG